MSVKLKVCGLTTLEDTRYCAGAGADYLGFIQHEASPRYVAPEKVKEMLEWLHGPQAVGVFVNKTADEVNAVAEEAGFDFVQLHGDEPPELCAAVERPVIKAIRVRHDASSDQLRPLIEPYVDAADFFLLDTHDSSMWGGTGESFNWRLARELSGEFPIFLAGGIDAKNVERAVSTMRPYAVDLSSSLESNPGQKDFAKMGTFFEVFREVNEAIDAEKAR